MTTATQNNNAAQAQTHIHPFEQAGLGLAPFRYVGMQDTTEGMNEETGMVSVNINGMQMETKPGGSCDYCGNYITVFCWIKGSDGRKFKVGTTCVEKTHSKGARILSQVQRDQRERSKLRRHGREDSKIDSLRAETIDNPECRAWLASLPHSNEWRRAKGDTMLDKWNFTLRGCGRSGMIRNLTKLSKEWRAQQANA